MNCIAITAHQISSSLEYTVLKASKNPKNIILIHVDKKSNIEPFLHLKSKNVIFIEKRIEVSWGDVSQIDATLELIKASLEYQYQYFHLISGDDILISQKRLDTLPSNGKYEYIAFQESRTSPINPDLRVLFNYPSLCFKKNNSFIEKVCKKVIFPYINIRFKLRLYSKLDIQLYKGTNWFSLTKGCIEMINSFVARNPHYKLKFARSLCADEVFFHSIIYNSEFKNNIYKHPKSLNIGSIAEHALRYVDWKSGPDYPRTLQKEDFQRVKNSEMLFSRKISSSISLNELRYFDIESDTINDSI
ncbi:beta-1,6-N-acetylglucosaminyltransferase [Pseudoalteromonas sp. A3]|uniref:beta-1,6-N-acetylglucosaminyltransferase n=1 Tax=Pseudoalteromonas sp. A3 TaxID=142792 RepID=UPI0022200DDF|nr:beta-1,6-N-acetylglucosaminyltransferase [Pseudoalteromonas sp. A3]MCW1718705.1 beta-1,6-N-acetylglucosaminyltransferase [Pseudoalteromonas sp. A3]